MIATLATTDSSNGEFSPNFDLKNMISTNAKDYSWNRQIFKGKNPKLPDFDDKFQ
jgi:hypothetical protein